MNTRLAMDKSGRVVIPKLFRDELQLGPGDSLEMECSDGKITLRPVRAFSTDEILLRDREERDLANPGKGE